MSLRKANQAILVICYRRTTHLIKVLEALANSQSIENYKIVFVVQDPVEPVLQIARSFPYDYEILTTESPSYYSSAQSINMNLFTGLRHCFKVLNSEYVVVLEDDIVLSADALMFFESVMTAQAGHSGFRGVNGFSETIAPFSNSVNYVRVHHGLGWGWAINQRTYSQLCKFWSGTEDNHWDFIFESFVRTGYVVNPIQSRVINIGFDETATHTSGDTDLGRSIQASFFSNQTPLSDGFSEIDIDFFWRGKNIRFSRISNFDLTKQWLIFIAFFICRDSRIYHRIRRHLQGQ